jgi:uncharacterized membrane protein
MIHSLLDKTRSTLVINKELPSNRPSRAVSPLAYRRGLILTVVCMLVFILLLGMYAITLHLAYGTSAEDMGIMDQVLWNTVHGHFWQETICNSIGDAVCLESVSRWAIHFEPTMLLLVPVYIVAPDPRTLQIIQIVGVALGALPAYWLGVKRLVSVVGGVGLAALYLLMPLLRSAVLFDFHMVTLAAPALMFALWYMEDRNDRGLLIAILLAIGMKEQVSLDIFMIGLWIAVGQRRWRRGAQIMALAVVWMVIAFGTLRMASPLGASPASVRYDGVLGTLSKIPLLWRDPGRVSYLGTLIANTGGIGLFAPWVLAMATPSILLNALSSYPGQYSGLYQYNADIVPFLVLATLEGLVVIPVIVRRLVRWTHHGMSWIHRIDTAALFQSRVRPVIICLAMVFAIFLLPACSTPARAIDPNSPGNWPHVTAHTKLAQQFIAQIPADVPVSAQAELVPHVSHRPAIYQFPDGVNKAAYIFLDMEGSVYPEPSEDDYVAAVRSVLSSGNFALVDAQDGYILLHRLPGNIPVEVVQMPIQFCPSSIGDEGKLLGIEEIMSSPCPIT